jgi:exodeoxyribonuclease VII large subunit
VPVRAELIAELMSKARRALACWQRAQDHRRTELRAAARALPSAEALLAIPRQRLDACAERLPRALRANAQIHQTQFSRVGGRLSPRLLRTLVERRRERYEAAAQRLRTARKAYREMQLTQISRGRDRVTVLADRSRRATLALIAVRSARLERSYQLLRAFSYQSVLERGFALVRDAGGHPLRSVAAVHPGMALDIEFNDGCVNATAESVRGSTASPTAGGSTAPKQRKAKRRSGGGSSGGSSGGADQGSLFG